MPPGGSALPGSVSSSPVPMSETRGRRTTHGRGMFSDARTPSSAGPSTEPAWMTSEPARMSSPAGRRCMPARIAPSTTIVPPSTVVSSCCAIASAPSGTGAPVEMRTVVPGLTATPASVPAFASPMSSSRADPPAVSAATIA